MTSILPGRHRRVAATALLASAIVPSSLSAGGIANRGSQASTPGTLGAMTPATGGKGNSAGWVPVPNLFLGAPLADGKLWLGLAVTSPFGLQLAYSPDWFGRYDSYDNDLRTIDVAPTIAYAVNAAWSIGGGINLQYADAALTSAIPDPLNPGGPTPATDGRSRLTGDCRSLPVRRSRAA